MKRGEAHGYLRRPEVNSGIISDKRTWPFQSREKKIGNVMKYNINPYLIIYDRKMLLHCSLCVQNLNHVVLLATSQSVMSQQVFPLSAVQSKTVAVTSLIEVWPEVHHSLHFQPILTNQWRQSFHFMPFNVVVIDFRLNQQQHVGGVSQVSSTYNMCPSGRELHWINLKPSLIFSPNSADITFHCTVWPSHHFMDSHVALRMNCDLQNHPIWT